MGVIEKVQAADDIRPARLPITVDWFLILDQAGSFERYARAELIEGEIYTVNAIHKPHAFALSELNIELGNALRASGLGLKLYSPVSARLDDHSLPEPDLILAIDEPGEFISAQAARLAIEVADSSLQFDLNRKARLYARSGIPEYWVVDVNGRQIHRHSAPQGEDYSVKELIPFGDRLQSATLPEIAIETAGLA
jgi:Uma2 family endonuclease